MSVPANTRVGVNPTGVIITIQDDVANDQAPTLSFESTDLELKEGQRGRKLEAILTGGVLGEDLTINLRRTSGTAIEGTDYVLAEPTITIPAGGTTGAVEFIADEDGIYEYIETVTYELTTPTTARVILGDKRSTVVDIIDLQEPPTVSLDTPASITEGSTGIVTVRLDGEYGFPLGLTLLASKVTASVSGLAILTPTLEIAPGDTMAEFEIEAIDDDLYEEDENFRLNLLVLGDEQILFALEPAIKTATMSHVITIEDDQPRPTVSLLAITDVSEGATATIIAELTGKLAVPVLLTLNTGAASSAVQFTDYLLSTPTLEIAAGDLTAQFEINAPTDGVLDGIKTVELALTVAGSVVNVVDGLQTLTILDADALRPSLTLDTVAPIDEGDTGVVTARLLNGNLTTPLTIIVETTLASDPTSAADSLDYSLSATTIEIPANSLDVTFTITITDDDVYEGEERFILSLKPVGDKVDLGTVTRTVTISDNDHLPSLPSLSLDPVGPLSESPTAAILTLRLSRAIKFTTTVSLSVVGGDADMLDYNLLQPSVEIGAGELTATAELRVVDDELYEGPETLRLRLTGTNAIVSFVPSEQTIQLVDADPIPSVSLESIGPVTEAAGVSVVVALTVPAKFTITVSLTHGVASTADVTDYRIEPSSIDIVAGQTTTTVIFYAEDDALYEGPETVQLNLRAFRDVTLLSEASAAITIIDNTQTPSVSFGALATTDAIEEGTLLNIALRLTGAVSTVDLTVALEASGTATEGDDYDRLPTLITIPAGKRTTTVELRTIDDLIDEDTETVVLDLRQVANGPRIGSPSQITIMIADNDLPTPEATLSSNTLSLTENETGTLEIVLTAVAAVDVTFTLEYLSGTADGADYRLTPEIVLIPAGADSATVSIFVEDDNYAEVEESLRLRLTSVSSGVSPTAPRVVTVTITDNDDVQVKIEGSALSVDERNPASGAALSVELTNAPNGAPEELIVDLAARGDDGGTADDVRIVDDNDMEITQVTIAAGASRAIFFVQAVDDDDLEYAETVNIYASAINSKAITDSGYDLAVLSDEGLLSGITVQDGTEGETVRVQIILSHLLPAQVPTGALSLVLLDGTTMNADVKILPRDIVADLKASKTTEVTIELTDDLLVEGVETFTVTLRIDSTLMPDLTALLELTPSPSSFTITDNDLVTAMLSQATLELSEGQTGTVEIRLTDDAPEDLTFTLELDGVSGDLTNSDYTLTPIVALIPAGADGATVSIFAVDDSDSEAVGSFTLRLESISTRVAIGTPGAITVTIPANDQPTTPVLPSAVTASLSRVSVMVPEGQTGTVEIRLTDNAPEDLTFTLELDSVSGDVTDSDYTLTPVVALIPAGANGATVSIFAVNDSDTEAVESFTLRLESVSTRVIIDTPRAITVTIPANDETTMPQPVVVTLQVSSATVAEGGLETLSIRLSEATTEDVTVTLTVAGTATVNADYEPLPSAPFVLTPGMTELAVGISTVVDGIYEGDETIRFAISTLFGPAVAGAVDRVEVTIVDLNPVPTLSLDLSSPSVTEGGDLTLTVTLSGELDVAVDITMSIAQLPASVFPAVTIPAGSQMETFTITIPDNDVYDGDLMVELALSGKSDKGTALTEIRETFTITENDQQAGITVTPITPVTEGDLITVEVVLDAVSSDTVTVILVDTSKGSAEAGIDYTLPVPLSVQITAGELRGIFRIDTTTNDNLYEGDETIDLELRLMGSSSVVPVTALIRDADQPPTVRFADSQPTTVAEDSAVEILVELDGARLVSDLTVEFEVDLASTATSADYVVGRSVVIAAGAPSVVITLTAAADRVYDGSVPETVELRLTGASGGISLGSLITHEVSITDTQTAPSVRFADSQPTTVAEGSQVDILVVLAGALTDDEVVVDFMVSGSADERNDYDSPIPQVTISPGEMTASIRLVALTDNRYDGGMSETVEFVLTTASGGVTLSDPMTHAVTIIDNEQPGMPQPPVDVTATLSLASVTLSEGGTATVEIRLTGNAPVDLTFTLELDSVSGDVTDSDYTLTPTVVLIPAGASRATVSIFAVNDSDTEAVESFTLRLESVSTRVAIDTPRAITVTIPANDQPTTPVLPSAVTATLSLENITVPEDEARTFEILLSGNAPTDLTFTLVGGPSGEYSLSPDPIVISKDGNRVTVTVMAVDDTDPESDEVFTLSLMSESSLVMIGDRGSITVTIPANDQEATNVEFVVTSALIDEGDEYEIELRLVDSDGKPLGLSQDIMVTLEVVNNLETTLSADEYLLDGVRGFSTTVNIPANEITGTVLFQSVEDSADESDEHITLRISAADQVSWQIGRTLRINVRDDDAPVQDVTATLSVPMLDIREDEKQTILVRLSEAPASDVTVELTPVSGTASEGDDYSLSPQQLTFTPSGALELSVLISGVLDSLYEGTEDAVFELSVVSGPAVTGAIDRVTVTIADSDPIPTLTLELSAPSVNEGDEITVSAVLNGKRADAVDVLLEIVGGTATLADYSTPTTLLATIPAMATRVAFVITAAADSIYDGVDPETLELRLSVPDSGVTTAPQTLTITDIDDLPTLTLDVPMEIGEGVGALALTATLSGVLDQDVELTLSVGGEASRDDYRLMTPTLTILAGEQTAMFELVIMDDKVYEATETLELTLSGQTTENEAFVPAVVTRMITDNDPRATIIILPIASVTEGDSLTITVVLTAVSNDPVTVTLLDTRTGDAEQTDYRLPAQLVETIAPNELTATFRIATSDDNLYEGAETIILRASTNKGDVVESTARINDEDTAPTVRFAASQPTTVTEGNPVEISVELDGARLEYDLTVEFEVDLASTATSADYVVGRSVVIAAGAPSVVITLTAAADRVYDGRTPETVVLRLTRASGGLPGINVDTTTTHTVSIMDDQSQPTLSLEPVAPSVTEGQMVTVEAVLNGALDEPLDVMLAVTGGDATTADYRTPAMLRVTIPAGETRVAFVITAAVDGIYEGAPETLELTLSTTNSEVMEGDLVRTLTIMDGDDLPTLSLEGVTDAPEGVGTLILTARLSGVLDVDVDVTLAVNEAVYMDDYMLLIPTMKISAGAETATFELVITDDKKLEGNEILTLSLSGQTADAESLATIESMLKIIDNDGAPTILLAPVATVTEGGNIEIVVNLIGTSATAIEVTLELLSSGTARENDDYTVPAQLSTTIPADGTEARFTVVTVDDELYEGTTPETLAFRVTSSNAGGGPLSGEAMIRDNDDAPTVIFTASSSSVTEGGSANVEVSLVGKLSESDVVVYFTVDSTTATGDDYTSPVTLATGVTIAADTRTAMITFDISADSVYDGSAPETVLLTLSSARNAVGTIARGTITAHTVMIDDVQTTAPMLSLDPITAVTEGDARTVEAVLTGALDEPVEVLLTVTGGDATTADYRTPAMLRVTIPAGETRVAFVITAAVDGIYEGAPETLELTLSTTNGEVKEGDLVRTLTIMDGDDLPTLSLEGVTDVPEGVGTLILTARLSGVLDVDVDVTLAVGGAVTTADYTLATPMMTISAGSSMATFELVITDDKKLEGNEILTLSLSGQTAEKEALATIERMLTIIDNDMVMIGFDPDTYTVNEDAGTVELTVKVLAGSLARDVMLTYDTMDGTATAGEDYTAVSMGTVTLSAGEPEKKIVLSIIDNNNVELSEMFTVILSGAPAGVMLDPSVATVTITDDVVIGFDPDTYTVNEDAGTVELTVKVLAGSLTRDVTLTYDTMDGTATAGEDYTAVLMGTVMLSAGEPEKKIVLSIIDDKNVELSEMFTVVLSGAPAGVMLDPSVATVTVTDDVLIGFSGSSYVVSEASGGVTITIDIRGRLTEAVTLGVEYVPGTASETEDYTPLMSEIQLSAGATRATLFVQIVNDELYENADTFSVRLVEPNGGLPLRVKLATGSAEADVTITNDDEIEIGFVEGMYTFLENQGGGTAQVRYSGSEIAPGVTVTVSYATTVEIGDSIDINEVSGKLMLVSGKRVYNIKFSITDDNAFNRATERYTVSLETLDMNSGLTFRLDRVSASLNVLTDDVLDFGFSVTEYEVNEDAGTVELEVSVLRNTIGAGESVVVRYSTTPGSATSSESRRDFEPVIRGEVTLSSMSTVARFTIQITDDDILEDSESFVVTLTKADGRDTLQLLQSKATVTILDDNDPVTVGFGRASYSVIEGAGAFVNLDVGVLSGGLERDITATYEIRAGSAVAGEDYVDVMAGTVTLSSDASKTISIALLDDDIFDPDEIFTVVLTGHHGPGSVMLAPASAIVTIVDAGPVPTISLDPVADVTEGNSRDVIARLSGKLNKDVTVKLMAKDVSTEAGDYSFNPTITIPAGSLLATFTVVAVTDTEYEGPEDVTLMVESDEVGPGTPIMRTLTINDNNRVTIGFQETTYRVTEGDGAKEAVVTVAVLTGRIASGVNIAVGYSTSVDSAVAGSDYTTVAGTLTFNSKDTVHTIVIPITDDETYEDAVERFTIGLTLVSSLARVSVAPAVSEILITDDDKPTLTIEIEGDIKVLEEGDSTVVTVRLSNAAANPITISLTALATTTSATIGTVESDDYTISPADRVIPVGATSITFALTALVNVQRERDEILALQASATGLESVSRELTIPGVVDAIIEPTRPPRTFLACETVDSGVQACVEVPKETVSASTVTLEIEKADAYQKVNIIAPADLPPATALLDEILIWDILFVDDNDIEVETLSNTVRIELTASKALVDAYGGPGVVSIATLHSGSTEWVALPTSYTLELAKVAPTGKDKYRFTAFSQNFSLFALIVPVTATLSPSAASVQEGQSIDLVITLSAPAGENIVFNLSKVGGDAVEGTHYSLPASITIIAGERSARVPLTTIYDFNSRSEVLEIELSVQGTAAVVGLMNRATITIVDDPPPVATLDVDEIQEGDSAVATYRLSHARAQVPITVSLRDIAGTSDLIISPASITLAPGETTAEFNLMAICDILPEGVETLTLEAISTELGSMRTTLDVRDIMLDIESVTELDEDDSAIVRVRLSGAGCNPTTVSLTAIGGTAEVDDYTLSQPSVTLDGADTIAEFRLTAHDDSQRERDETLVLEASVVGLESVMTTITIIDLVEDDGTGLPPTGGLAFPLWLVAVLLLTGLTLVVGTVYVVRRPRSTPRV